jgi:hypothetical protein
MTEMKIPPEPIALKGVGEDLAEARQNQMFRAIKEAEQPRRGTLFS